MRRTFILASLLAAVGSGCGGGGSPASLAPVTKAVSVSASASPTSIQAGQGFSYSCSANGTNVTVDNIAARYGGQTINQTSGASISGAHTPAQSGTFDCIASGGGISGTSTATPITVTEAQVDAQDITPLDELVVGQGARYRLVGTPAGGAWNATAIGARVDSLKADILFATPITETHSITATLTAQGKSDAYTETFAAAEPFVTAQLDFNYDALNDGGVITGNVLLSNGKTVPIVAGRALITPKDSVREGPDSVTMTGRMQTQRRWIDFVNNMKYALSVTGPDAAQYDLIMGLTWSGATMKWESAAAPVFIIDDVARMDVVSDAWTRNKAVASDRLLQSDDIADIVYFVQTVLPLASNYASATFVRASANSVTATRFTGPASGFPAGCVYNGTYEETSFAIAHGHSAPSRSLVWAINLKTAGLNVSRSSWISDLLESLGYNTNVSTSAIIDAQAGTVKPFLSEVSKYFYSPQRPAGSGRINGVADYINNKSSPDKPVGPIS